jgi:murein L,D-transpeptidase YcbB/YkuD
VDWTGRRFRVIQEPGPNNAMGEVKFLFPNVHNVYIHDTPHRELFGNAQRSESAGCVRVRDPEALAIWALEAEGWSPARVREAFAGERTMRVSLQHAIPVHILYFTAVTDSSNQVRFVHDIYARDQRLVAALDGARVARAPALGAARDENASPAP